MTIINETENTMFEIHAGCDVVEETATFDAIGTAGLVREVRVDLYDAGTTDLLLSSALPPVVLTSGFSVEVGTTHIGPTDWVATLVLANGEEIFLERGTWTP